MRTDTAVYETDVQGDFVYRTGALFVNGQKGWTNKPYGAEARLPNVIELHNYAEATGMRILGSVDRHFYEDVELIRNEGGVFDDHCMNGTEGQLRIKELEPQKDIYVRAKDGPLLGIRNYTVGELDAFVKSGMHLIFEKQSYDVVTNPNFDVALRQLAGDGLRKIIVNGFATDYCVRAAVEGMAKIRDARGLDLQLYVVRDAVEEVNIDFTGNVDMDFGKKALEEMVGAEIRAKLVTTADVLEGKI